MARDAGKNKRSAGWQSSTGSESKPPSNKRQMTTAPATIVFRFLVAFFQDDNTGTNDHINNAPTNSINNLFQRMVVPFGTASLVYPHNARATVDANLNPNLPPPALEELYGQDGTFDLSAIRMACNYIIGANGSFRFEQTDNHASALNSFASILIVRCPHPTDATQNIDKLISVKRITVGDNINLAIILDGGNPNASVRVIVNPNADDLISIITEDFGTLGPLCIKLAQPLYTPPAIHPNPLRYNPSVFTYYLNSFDPIHPHRHFKLVRIYSNDTAQVVDAPASNEELYNLFPRTDVSLEVSN